MRGANPITFADIKLLFTLRHLTESEIRDFVLDGYLEAAQLDKSYPNFDAATLRCCCVESSRILERINGASIDAQVGRFNQKLLLDDKWHMKEVFPKLEKKGSGPTRRLATANVVCRKTEHC